LLAHLVVARSQLEVAVDPVAEKIRVTVGHADHLGDPMHRDVLRILRSGVGSGRTT
jgi:hypothetical protein